jgi:hypothetical protein
MAEAARAFNLPTLAAHLFKGRLATMGIALPPELRHVAQTFLELQARRHEADYDLTQRFNRRDVLALCDKVEQAMRNWESIRNEPIARLFILALLFWERMSKGVH